MRRSDTDLAEAVDEATRLETGSDPIGYDLFGAWEDDPEGTWPELRRYIEEEWPDLDSEDLSLTRGRPGLVVRLIGEQTGLDHRTATDMVERLLREHVQDRRARVRV